MRGAGAGRWWWNGIELPLQLLHDVRQIETRRFSTRLIVNFHPFELQKQGEVVCDVCDVCDHKLSNVT